MAATASPKVSPAVRRRSVALGSDPAMREMVHFVGSHEHDSRLQEAANIRSNILKDLPENFKEEVEVLRQAEAFEDNRPLPVTSTGLLDGPSVDARLAWRQEMDRQVKRLLQDTHFALDDRLDEEVKHILRVNHADRMYDDWYGKHGMKQARKERVAPSHLRFNHEDPVMPGSLRRPKEVAPALLAPAQVIEVPREVPHFPSPKVEESRPASRSVATPKTLLTAGRATVKPVSPRVSPRAKKPQTPGEMQKTRTGLWSRARSAAADVTSAWEKCLGHFDGAEEGNPAPPDEAIGAWLNGAMSGAMCGAQVLESTVRGPVGRWVMDVRGRLDEPLLSPDTSPGFLDQASRAPPPVAADGTSSEVLKKIALSCGGRLIDELQGPESHALFDVTLEHALRLYEACTEDEGRAVACSSLALGERQETPKSPGRPCKPFRAPSLEMSLAKKADELNAGMDVLALKNALESEGFKGLDREPLFQTLWKSLGQETIDVHSFHRVLRQLKLHLLCSGEDDFVEERGFFGVVDWNQRVVCEQYFTKVDQSRIFLGHRLGGMKMRWVHCSAVSKVTILRLAVKYQLHPLPVEDTIQLQQQSVPLVRRYGDNFFIILPMLRLTTPSRNALAAFHGQVEGQPELARQTTNQDELLDPDSGTAFEVEIEQGRLALFVAGAPKFDTLISFQTNWVVHKSEDVEHGHQALPVAGARRFCRRRRANFNFRSSRALIRDGSASCRSRADSASSPRTPSMSADIDFEDAEGSDAVPFDDDATEAFDGIVEEIQKDSSMLRSGNAAWLMWRVVDVIVDEMEPILSAFRARLQWFAAHIAKRRSKADNDVEKKLLWTRVELEWVQRKVRPMIRVVRHMIHEKSIEADVTQYLEDVEDHLGTYLEEISRSIGVCDSLRDQVRSLRDRDQQGVLYALALVTTMTSPMQLLSSMYGMNFVNTMNQPVVPGLGPMEVKRGYSLFWGLGVAIVSTIYISFRFVLKWM
ncbi:unnamed protein product [Durusdinium trenchii]|uniref:Magnesium transporter n=1 Tax=Durusdinium trenchii TaxID=1381693 RepID=A0ABP0HXE6_9DINO